MESYQNVCTAASLQGKQRREMASEEKAEK